MMYRYKGLFLKCDTDISFNGTNLSGSPSLCGCVRVRMDVLLLEHRGPASGEKNINNLSQGKIAVPFLNVHSKCSLRPFRNLLYQPVQYFPAVRLKG